MAKTLSLRGPVLWNSLIPKDKNFSNTSYKNTLNGHFSKRSLQQPQNLDVKISIIFRILDLFKVLHIYV